MINQSAFFSNLIESLFILHLFLSFLSSHSIIHCFHQFKFCSFQLFTFFFPYLYLLMDLFKLQFPLFLNFCSKMVLVFLIFLDEHNLFSSFTSLLYLLQYSAFFTLK